MELTDTNRSKTWPMVYGPIWYFYLVFRVQNMKNCAGKSVSRKSGDNSEEVTPVPISNTVVKLLSADDTWWEAAWESRTLPVFYLPKYFTIAIQNEDSICCLFSFWQRLYFPKGWFPSILYAASPQGRKPWNLQDCACALYGRCRFFITLIYAGSR